MDYLLIGEIKKIIPLKYGICVKIREKKIGGISKNGHEMGTYDYTWNCIANSEALVRYIKNYFKVRAYVKVKGFIEQLGTYEDKIANLNSIIIKIESIDLWNMNDPKKKKMMEKYNANTVGDNQPNIKDNFNNDFNLE